MSGVYATMGRKTYFKSVSFRKMLEGMAEITFDKVSKSTCFIVLIFPKKICL